MSDIQLPFPHCIPRGILTGIYIYIHIYYRRVRARSFDLRGILPRLDFGKRANRTNRARPAYRRAFKILNKNSPCVCPLPSHPLSLSYPLSSHPPSLLPSWTRGHTHVVAPSVFPRRGSPAGTQRRRLSVNRRLFAKGESQLALHQARNQFSKRGVYLIKTIYSATTSFSASRYPRRAACPTEQRPLGKTCNIHVDWHPANSRDKLLIIISPGAGSPAGRSST